MLFIQFRWILRSAMRPIGLFESPPSFPHHNECIVVVGVSRPKLAALFITVMILSLFLTFHILYDSTIYSIQVMIIIQLPHTHTQTQL